MPEEILKYREMQIEDYNLIIKLFTETPGITVRDADSFQSTKKYLERNPGLSFVAETNEELIGCIMCGHDARRGYLQHLVVKENFRCKGIGQTLTEMCLEALEKVGILKSHLFVLADNYTGKKFWENRGWKLRNDISMYSYINSKNKNI